MELKELIERAEKIAGSQKTLALRIGQSESNIRAAKSGARGLPNYACMIIADMIGEEHITVIAASELVTEKKEERREVWRPFVGRAASVTIAISLGVITLVTPSPAEAAQMLQVTDFTVYIMSNLGLTEMCFQRITSQRCTPLLFPVWAILSNQHF